jgi:hypothetical protein
VWDNLSDSRWAIRTVDEVYDELNQFFDAYDFDEQSSETLSDSSTPFTV